MELWYLAAFSATLRQQVELKGVRAHLVGGMRVRSGCQPPSPMR